jgi:integrase
MSLYKRGNTWWIDFTASSGKRIKRSTETGNKAEAQELHDRLKAEHWRLQKLREQPNHTCDEAASKWLYETAHKRTHQENVLKLSWLQQFLRNRGLAEVTRDEIAAIGARKRTESSNATANRYLALIRAILRKVSLEWEWIDRVPKVKMYPKPKRRVRWITPKQAKALLEALPEHQRAIALFALATGLRQSNVVWLRWSQVDIERRTAWIAADEAKGGEDIHISLCELAVEVLEGQRGKHSERVFTYESNPIRYVNTKAWRNALKRAGIADLR